MSTKYLIEIRLSGETKSYLKNLIFRISDKFRVHGVTKRHVVPHVTLFGPLVCSDEQELIRRFVDVCKNNDLPTYELNGFDVFEQRVIYANIYPLDTLRDLRNELSKKLKPICNSFQPHDGHTRDQFKFHATLAFRDVDEKFSRIWEYLKHTRTPRTEEYVLRITLLKGSRILREYDVMQRRLLRRDQALNKHFWMKTREILKEIQRNNGKRKITEIEIRSDPWIISDLHFDHENIIKYCNRPFKDREEINKTLLENWNSAISPGDDVLFLGDMAFGRGSHSSSYWLSKLNGNIYFIKGNHEEINIGKVFDQVILNCSGERYFLTHDPALAPKDWDEWIIHGHHHNNNVNKFPLINRENKTINVSCELLNYKPIRLSEIIKNI